MALGPALTPEVLKDMLDTKWDVGTTTLNPRLAARIVSIDDQLDAAAYTSAPPKISPRARPQGKEVEPGVFVWLDEDATFQTVTVVADFSLWPGDKEDIWIPDAGQCARRAGIDPVFKSKLDPFLWKDREALAHAIKNTVSHGKRALTDRLLEHMGTSRSEVMEEHFARLANYRDAYDRFPDTSVYNRREPIIPAAVDKVFWEETAKQAAEKRRVREMREREAAEAARIKAEIAAEKRELAKLSKEIIEQAAIEANPLHGAWG